MRTRLEMLNSGRVRGMMSPYDVHIVCGGDVFCWQSAYRCVSSELACSGWFRKLVVLKVKLTEAVRFRQRYVLNVAFSSSWYKEHVSNAIMCFKVLRGIKDSGLL